MSRRRIFVFAGHQSLLEGVRLDSMMLEQLDKWGYEAQLLSFDSLSSDLLDGCSIVALIYPGKDVNLESVRNLLHNYMRHGGGVLLFSDPVFYTADPFVSLNAFLDPYGARILDEVITVEDDSKMLQQTSMYQLMFAMGDAYLPGVSHVCYPYIGMEGARYIWPMSLGKDWRVAVSAGASAVSKSYDSDPPIVALRDVESGKLAVVASLSSFWLEDAYHKAWGDFVYGRGDGLRLMRQLLDTLACDNSADIEPRLLIEESIERGCIEKPTLAANRRVFRGIIGAASGCDADKVQAYRDAAHMCGYDFIVFAEDYESLDASRWECFKSVCSDASNDSCRLIPGLQVRDAYGNEGIYLGGSTAFPNPEKLAREGFFHLLFGLGGEDIFSVLILTRPSAGPWPPWHIKFYSALEVIGYEDGKLVEDNKDLYRTLQASYYNVLPVCIKKVTDPAELANWEGFESYVLAQSLDDVLSAMGKREISGFVSSGPIIERFEISPAVTDPWLTYLYWQQGEKNKIYIRVHSSSPITEVRLYRRENVIRRFKLNETIFEVIVEEVASQDGPYMLEVFDSDGGIATSTALLTRNRRFQSQCCADLQNFILSAMDTETNSPVFHSVYAHGWEAWGPRMVVPLKEIFPPALDIPIGAGMHTLGTDTRLMTISGTENLIPHRTCSFASEECVIYDNFYYTSCALQSSLYSHNPYHYAYFKELESFNPSKDIESQARYICFSPKIGGYNVILIELTARFKRDVKLAETDGLNVVLLNPSANVIVKDGAPALKLRGHPRFSFVDASDTKRVGDTRFSHNEVTLASADLARYGYASLWPDELGSFAVYALDDKQYSISIGGVLRTDREDIAIGFRMPGAKFEAGTVWHDRFLFILDNGKQSGDEEFERIWRECGFVEDSALPIEVERGTLLETRGVVRLLAHDGAAVCSIGEIDLPFYLGVILEGLNSNWDVGLFDYETGILKRLGAFEDRAYFVVDTKTPTRFIAGNLLICNDCEVRLSLLDINNGCLEIEVHNPSDMAKHIIVTSPFWMNVKIEAVMNSCSSRVFCIIDG